MRLFHQTLPHHIFPYCYIFDRSFDNNHLCRLVRLSKSDYQTGRIKKLSLGSPHGRLFDVCVRTSK